MKTVLKKKIILETKRHDFDNQLAYIEVWQNTSLKDCFFAEKDFLFSDGSVKVGGTKYFYSPSVFGEVEKEIRSIKPAIFSSFESLYYIDVNGEILKAGEFKDSHG